MKPITIYTANCREDKFNACYPIKRIIRCLDDFVEATRYDQVFAEYIGCHRSNDDFIRSDEAFEKNGHNAQSGVSGTGSYAPSPYEP